MTTIVTFDKINNRIVIQNTELEPENKPNSVTSTRTLDYNWHLSPEDEPFRLEVKNIDFEGLVFNLVDIHGNSFSTEIIGQVASGTL